LDHGRNLTLGLRKNHPVIATHFLDFLPDFSYLSLFVNRRWVLFFEGSEKKVELVTCGGGSLRERPRVFWEEVVSAAGAQILSEIRTDHCDAYLLSESSLFVWADRVVMITCGKTTLVSATLKMIDAIDAKNIQSLIFQRKNEYFPEEQHSQFREDVQFLEEKLEGQALVLGDPQGRHMQIYYLCKPYEPDEMDTTTEILMYNLGGRAKEVFGQSGLSAEEVREKTSVHLILPDFKVDDWVFSPLGYSLNAVNGPYYYTIHVTPEEGATYASFETNYPVEDDITDLVNRVCEVFQPANFDVVAFHPQKDSAMKAKGQDSRHKENHRLNCGYHLTYSIFDMNQQDYQ
jgi:S-adenosylmethionine decarboxylase